ncbi:MAG TPA: hypothetical protein VJ961_09650 [Mariprofundaceae bacterium]|nr:hypothetical protein [Mariprofundaceae bacterium]
MKAALRSKLASVSAPMHLEEEIGRFLPWLPPQVQPFVREARRWSRRHSKEPQVQKRIDIEQQALDALKSHIALRTTMPGQGLMEEFLIRVEEIMRNSYAAREAALRHERVDGELDIRMLTNLEHWLEENPDYPDEPELTAWLRRVVKAWRYQFSR